MCFGCYEGYGKPKIINDRTKAALALVEKVYEFSCAGGNLHCELDDWNLDDFKDFVPFDPDTSPEQLAIERECFDAFKAMSVEERASTLAMRDGFMEP